MVVDIDGSATPEIDEPGWLFHSASYTQKQGHWIGASTATNETKTNCSSNDIMCQLAKPWIKLWPFSNFHTLDFV